jgi:hypothetical protein
MARSVQFKVGSKSHTLVGSFKAGERISAEVADLLDIQREAALAAMMVERGLPYQPKWKMGVKDVVAIFTIGLDSIGAEVDAEDVGKACFAMGFDKAHNLAMQYLQLFFAEPETTPDTDGNEPAGK